MQKQRADERNTGQTSEGHCSRIAVWWRGKLRGGHPGRGPRGWTEEAAQRLGGEVEKQSESAGGTGRGVEGWRQGFPEAPRTRDAAPHRQGGAGEVRGGIFALPALSHAHSVLSPLRAAAVTPCSCRVGLSARGDATVYTGIPETGKPAPIGWRTTKGTRGWDSWMWRLGWVGINTCQSSS